MRRYFWLNKSGCFGALLFTQVDRKYARVGSKVYLPICDGGGFENQ
jgi:hypothetical protein